MRLIILLFLILGCTISNAQTDLKKEIIGSWELVTEVNAATNKEPDPFIDSDVFLTFKNNDVLELEVKEFVLEARYILENTTLTIGKKLYTILGIKQDKLFFKPKDSTVNFRYEYKRIKSNE